eukprot:COSAG02_NODE_54_length_43941_cov_54.857990_26_plen_113_part_00
MRAEIDKKFASAVRLTAVLGHHSETRSRNVPHDLALGYWCCLLHDDDRAVHAPITSECRCAASRAAPEHCLHSVTSASLFASHVLLRHLAADWVHGAAWTIWGMEACKTTTP